MSDPVVEETPGADGADAAPAAVIDEDTEDDVAPESLEAARRRQSTALTAEVTTLENESPIVEPATDIPNNLCELEEMTQANLLAAVKGRYEADAVYTYVADILVAVNPYRWVDMYGKNYKERYNPTALLNSVPHVYSVAQAAAKNLRMLNRNQVCLISGESGAGKTETAKLFMHHLLTYSGSGAGETSDLENKIMESQPLLEAFGNAKTGLNDNSSRFGKYIEVLFENMDIVAGARVRKYLLEKARVIAQVEGERNFHAFYYLADSATGTKLGLKGSDGYRYTKVGGVDPAADARFNELDGSLRALGFDELNIASLWTVLAAILKTGELEFVDIEGSTDDSCKFKDDAIAQDLAETLEVTPETLLNALTTRHLVTAGETFHKPLTAEFSAMNADTMAGNMYDNLFSWLVDQLNSKMSTTLDNLDDQDEYATVAVLDIFGFENFKANGFEQLFINTANEKLQHYFIEHIFTYEIKELREEGVKCPKVEYTSNLDQVEVLLGKPGIFSLLDEQTKVPNSSDKSTILKFHSDLGANPSYDNVRNSTIEFQIAHYAGEVRYNVEGFLEKNRNAPSLGISGMIKGSGNPMIASLFKSSVTTEEKQKQEANMKQELKLGGGFVGGKFMRKASRILHKKKSEEPAKPKRKLAPWQLRNLEAQGVKPVEEKKKRLVRVGSEKKRAQLDTLGAAFKGSLDDLMEMLNAATPHFIRCIKPNMEKKARTFEPKFTQKQLNYTGVLETSKMRQVGYPLRVTFMDFVDRYRDVCMPPTQVIHASSAANTCVRILQSADLHGWAKGKSKMLLQYDHVRVLVGILEGRKRAANAERAAAKVIQDKKDAEAAVIKAKRDAEIAKIRAAAEAQPSKIANQLSWQEEMDLAKKKKAAAKKKREEEEAKAAAEAAANAPAEDAPEEDVAAVRKNAFSKLKGMWK